MKPVFATIGLIAAAGALAQDQGTFAGTKASPPTMSPGGTSNVGFGDLFQMLLALGIVLAILKFVLPKAMAKFGRRLSTPFDSPIRIEESASFGGGQLSVVTVRGKTLLLSTSAQGVTCLADLTASEAPKAEEPAFFDVLDKAVAEAVTPEAEPAEEPDKEAIQAVLDRLSRLTA